MRNLQNINITNWRRLQLASAAIAAASLLTLLMGCAGPQLSSESAVGPASIQAVEAPARIATVSLNDNTTTSVTARLKQTGVSQSGTNHHPAHSGHSSSELGPKSKPESAMYRCPMHPEIKQSEPGDCSICGMNLVPI